MSSDKIKTRKMLHIVVTRFDGSTFENPLTLSETHLISKMAKENKSLEVSYHTVSEAFYKSTFGK